MVGSYRRKQIHTFLLEVREFIEDAEEEFETTLISMLGEMAQGEVVVALGVAWVLLQGYFKEPLRLRDPTLLISPLCLLIVVQL